MRYVIVVLFLLIVAQPAEAETKKFWVASGVLAATTIYDMETSIYTLGHNTNARESNVVLSPFLKKGRPAAYTYQAAVDLGLMLMVHRFKKEIPNLRFLPLVVVSAGHGLGGSMNLRIALK